MRGNYSFKINYSRTKFEKLAQKLGAGATIEPQDAKLVITRQDTIQIIPGKQGKVIDTQNALAQIEDILNEKQEPVLNLVLKTKEPEMTTQEVENMHVNGIISHFSTFFNVQKTNRVYNIKVAAGALDGTFIKPGETFSFNKVVGPRSKEAGYKLAPTILNNEFIDSLGGGGMPGIDYPLQRCPAGWFAHYRKSQPFPGGQLRSSGAGRGGSLRGKGL